jgi:hypothetical protein
MDRYEHQQHSTWMYWVAIVVLAVFVLIERAQPAAGVGLAIGTIAIAVSMAIFARLSTRVDDRAVSWSFGWGWPRGSIALADIASVEGTETNLLEGWGIHWTIWHGWLWNTGGFQAVEMITRTGSRVTLGTDDPQGLYDAIVAHRNAL